MNLICQRACAATGLETDVGKGGDTLLREGLRPEVVMEVDACTLFCICGATREKLSHCLCHNPLNKQYIKIDGRVHIPSGARKQKPAKYRRSVLWFPSTGCVFFKSLKKRSFVESIRCQLLRRLYTKFGTQRSRLFYLDSFRPL